MLTIRKVERSVALDLDKDNDVLGRKGPGCDVTRAFIGNPDPDTPFEQFGVLVELRNREGQGDVAHGLVCGTETLVDLGANVLRRIPLEEDEFSFASGELFVRMECHVTYRLSTHPFPPAQHLMEDPAALRPSSVGLLSVSEPSKIMCEPHDCCPHVLSCGRLLATRG